MRRKIFSPLPALVLCVLVATAALAQSGGTYDLSWNTVDGGGATFSTGSTYSLGGTAGQPDAGSMNGGTYALDGGFWNGIAGKPTAALLALFQGRFENAAVTLEWITSSETDLLGFNVWRSATKTGTYKQLNTEIITARNSGGGEMHYTYSDATAARGKNFYKLEMVETGGTSEWSDVVRVNVDDASTCATPLAKPKLTEPRIRAVLATSTPTLTWDAVECATHYFLVVRRESKQGHVVHKEKNLTLTEFQIQELNAGKTYYWRVSACSAAGCKKSEWRTFSIQE